MTDQTPRTINISDLHSGQEVILDFGGFTRRAFVVRHNYSVFGNTVEVRTEEAVIETIHGQSTPQGIGWRLAPAKTSK